MEQKGNGKVKNMDINSYRYKDRNETGKILSWSSPYGLPNPVMSDRNGSHDECLQKNNLVVFTCFPHLHGFGLCSQPLAIFKVSVVNE